MQFKDAWLKDPTIFAINRLPAHSDHEWYSSEDDYYNGENCCALSLNGKWKFHYAKNLLGRIKDFESLLVDCRDWDDITVPGHIQMQGYGTPVYVNTMYPWTGREQLVPGEIPQHDNPVASYVKYFNLSEDFAGHDLHLTFDGVETAFALYINGIFVGYSEDSFTPSHFDVSEYMVAGLNKIAVQVFRYASASWLEDQDFWRFSGIFRDVTLFVLPKVHVYDLSVTADLYEDYTKAHVGVDMKFAKPSKGIANVAVYDADQELVEVKSVDFDGAGTGFEIDLENIHLWSAEDPYLYEVMIDITDEEGELIERVTQPLGLRQFELVDGIMRLNGKRVIFNGVNRHEFAMESGRCVNEDLIYDDLVIMKQNNINAVRTSHYPNQSCFYRFCDELGLYVIDETNLETHGTWQISEDVFDIDLVLPNDNPDFRNAVLDRARSLYERDKNHSCVLIWSCGNESYGGKTLFEMSEYFRNQDPRRLVHYEGIFHDRRFNDTSDIESQMYTPAKDVAAYLDEHHDKPFILCEYAHAMGNSNGALYKYTDLVDQYDQYQGGFIWDFVDQAILKDGRLLYGGDFGERPSDFDFCGNGIVFADRSLTPKMQEVKFCYQPMTFERAGDGILVIKNRHLFTDLSAYDFVAELAFEGELLESFHFELPCEPEQEEEIALPFYEMIPEYGEFTVTVRALLKEATVYADAGHEVAFGQFVFSGEKVAEEAEEESALRISYDGFTLGIVGEHFHIFFNMQGMVDYTYGGVHYLYNRTARPNFFRPSTQNDRANQYGFRYGKWLQASLYQQSRYQGYETDEAHHFVKVKYTHQLFNDDSTTVDVTYTIDTTGKVVVDMELIPSSTVIEAPEFGFMMTLPVDFDRVTYYGYGPMENYIDRVCGAKLGIFEYDVDENFTPYLMPQECGNRTGVRDAVIEDDQGHGLMLESEACELSVLRYLPMEIENAAHVEELPEPYQTVVRISAKQMGIAGDNTWGAKTHEEFLLPKGEKMHFTFSFKGC